MDISCMDIAYLDRWGNQGEVLDAVGKPYNLYVNSDK